MKTLSLKSLCYCFAGKSFVDGLSVNESASWIRLKTLSIVLLAFGSYAVAAPSSEYGAPAFQKGDSVCFIGDSITHGGIYHKNIVLFYATRFPGQRFESFNCGLSGDSASGALRRFDYDIASHKPTISTIMLGMNDVNRSSYGKDKTDAESVKSQNASMENYSQNMEALSQKLKALGSKIIYITPSIYDQTGTQETPNLFGVNDALRKCGELGKVLGKKYQGGLIDFHETMTRINAEQQAKDPNLTIVGKDRVHPGEVGHLIMTYQFLKGQKIGSCVSIVQIDAAQSKVNQSERCSVTELKSENGIVSFKVLEQSLPFPITKGSEQALELVPFIKDLNQEILAVKGLPAGSYEIVIDGTPVQTVSAEELARGVNLAVNDQTPQYKQAVDVKAIGEKRHSVIGTLRTIECVWHFTLSKVPGLERSDFEGSKKAIEESNEANKKKNFAHGIHQNSVYLKSKPQQIELEKEVWDLTDSLWNACVPKQHEYVIRLASAAKR